MNEDGEHMADNGEANCLVTVGVSRFLLLSTVEVVLLPTLLRGHPIHQAQSLPVQMTAGQTAHSLLDADIL